MKQFSKNYLSVRADKLLPARLSGLNRNLSKRLTDNKQVIVGFIAALFISLAAMLFIRGVAAKAQPDNSSLAAQAGESPGFQTAPKVFPELRIGEAPASATINARLVDQDGNRYGAAVLPELNGGVCEAGALFRISNAGEFQILHTFTNADGARPVSDLLLARDGFLYGVTQVGGAHNQGGLFRIAKDGSNFALVYSFSGMRDGANPQAGLIESRDGRVYGTTARGGAFDRGTIFRLNSDGSLATLHEFNVEEGANPQAKLLEGKDNFFYGSTRQGGRHNLGTIFKLAVDGSSFATLHSFDGRDGASPESPLVQAKNGTLYGVTMAGGEGDEGLLFRLSPDGARFKPLYSFKGYDSVEQTASDGESPLTLAVARGGNIYGTTGGGGRHNRGVVFRVSSSGKAYQVIHHYGAQSDPRLGLEASADGEVRLPLRHFEKTGEGSLSLNKASGTLATQAIITIADGDTAALAAAINTSNTNNQDDVINLATNGTYTFATPATPGIALPVIQNDSGHTLTINGNGSTLQRSTADGTPNFRLLLANANAVVTLNDLTVRNGRVQGTGFDHGGGLAFAPATATLNRCAVSGNFADGIGGGILHLFSGTTLTMNDCVMSGNTGILGGGIGSQGSLIAINRCVITNNAATAGGGLGIAFANDVTMNNSEITHNRSSSQGGALEIENGSIARLINCTVSDNQCGQGARGNAFSLFGVLSGIPSLTLTNCTVSHNSSGTGGLFLFEGNAQYRNTIFASNQGGNVLFDPADSTITSLGNNLSSDGTGNLNAPGDLPNADPQLGPLQNNGGPTRTRALSFCSPAINAGTSTEAPPTDQRGFPRLGAPDIGAFEFQLPRGAQLPFCLQDDSNANTILQFDPQTGSYQFHCSGTVVTGVGSVIKLGSTYTLTHITLERRVLATLVQAVGRGTAVLQAQQSGTLCTITDRNVGNNSCLCTSN
jgi:uncharacterized repeat protein (TIGR03803 family)